MTWEVGERAKTLWRQAPAIRKLPDVLRKYGIEVDPTPFEKLAKHVEEREEYMWGELQKLLQGLSSSDCVLERRKVRKSEVIRLKCPVHNGKIGATLLEEAVETLYDALPEAQKQWLKENGEKLLIGFEMADVAIKENNAKLNTSDGFNVVVYALAKYATCKKLRRFYVYGINLTKRGARPAYQLEAEATLFISKKMLYETARRGVPPPPHLAETFKSPAAWLGLILGDGIIVNREFGISTGAPELIYLLIPYTAGRNRHTIKLRRFVANIVIRHAESVSRLFDVLAEAFRDAMPIGPKWARLKKLASTPIRAKTIVELVKNGDYALFIDLLGELRLKEPDLLVFRRKDYNTIVYTYVAEIDSQWHAAQARFKYRKRKWRASLCIKNLQLLEKLRTRLKLRSKIYRKKSGCYVMELYGTAMV